MRFEGISDPETAKLYGGSWICVPAEQATRPKDGWIEADLISLPLIDENEIVLGNCKGLANLPMMSIAVTSVAGKEIILPMEGPLAPRIDLEGGKLVVDREVWDALS